MKLLFVFTGGTIGSTVSGDTVSPDGGKPYALLQKYAERYPLDFTYDTLSPLYELSENFSGEQISRILQTVSMKNGEYDGIIVTHGTDTLQYSAAALGYALGNDTPPVCLVGAGYPMEDARSNAIPNLHAAVTLIRTGSARGVFVPYKNPADGDTLIHRATRLAASLPYADTLYAVDGVPYGRVNADGAFTKDPAFKEKPDALGAPSTLALEATAPILRVYPHPGVRYPAIPDGVRAILLEGYHSGTVNTKSAATHAFLREANAKDIPVFLTGATGAAAYESIAPLAAYGVTPLLRIAPIAAFMKLWLYGDADGELLHTPRGGDLF